MVNVMADNVDDDVCSYIGKSNSSSTNSLKQIDLTQSNQQQQPLDDADHINNSISISTEVSAHFQFIAWISVLFSLSLSLSLSQFANPSIAILQCCRTAF